MKYYFLLQISRMKRWFSEQGVAPVFGIILMFILIFGGGFALCHATENAYLIFAGLAVYMLIRQSISDTNKWLKENFLKQLYYKIRLLENGILIVPFAIFLIVENKIYWALALIVVAFMLAFANIKWRLQRTIPTPFWKNPFELIVGFRYSYWLLIGIYLLLLPAIRVPNPNLGLFALILLFFACMGFYYKPEKQYWVWIYALDSRTFLWKKVLQAWWGSTILSLPLLLILVINFNDMAYLALIIQLLGYAYLVLMIMAKYASFPFEMNLPQALLFSMSIFFPPMLVVIIPIFYKQAIKRLKPILEC